MSAANLLQWAGVGALAGLAALLWAVAFGIVVYAWRGE